MQRREFLTKSSLVLGSSLLPLPVLVQAGSTQNVTAVPLEAGDWPGLRKQFLLSYDYIHLATFLLASHPKPVADAIARHRQAFDVNPADYWHEHFMTIDADIAAAAARYMGGKAENIALTDSTTMGLALVYSGLQLTPGDEILQTVHDHYSTDLSLQLRAERTGASVRQVALYDNPAQVSVDQVVSRLKAAIRAATRVVAVTWVHSSTGVKLPLHAIAAMLADVNQQRYDAEQILFCVDGVHGFGIEDIDVSTIGCDFFIAGTHKWIFGPRGTGVIWGSDKGWSRCKAVIPSFSRSYDVWLGGSTQDQVAMGEHMTPGGFHSFEHRWALPEAFNLHLQLGKAKVQQRIHQLNTLTKQGLQQISGVTLHTPMAAELSSGLVCFDYKTMAPDDVVKAMHGKGIIMSSTPYRQSYARFAPSLINNEQEIEQTLAALRTV
ncbi:MULTISPECIES: aminotransferase class V-fold PLP-dependent enzyme [unclassified Arsukibacterium]|uniref:aminotransferase class V-fold PLP-dependent enzyme n=1 Tax=unclassified Arsukibacterium TaxID=2635278 RepID=UPI000C4B2C75|nr:MULTISPECIES: aminotransferase class V-fold PLP-dependent enzyme [unclassified Arsukibacterium]MAA95197.1 aminotransferase [Rheinheimera sp.]MBM35128.1 aminotransferase [Rheinheimera sp.]HAW93499.1 aminotransferase [Candidatus Azambacteria bacterium]|tara:strand:+ start:14851 stop:16158 length:1308 start_codon:yes stop_codon:yes gene_type:complete